MRTELCDLFGIEYPIFAFTHCRDVVAAVSKAGGLGVLGAVGLQSRAARDRARLDRRARRRQAVRRRHRDAAEVGRRRTAAAPRRCSAQIRSMIDANHWRYVDELMERFDLPPLPEGEEPARRARLDRRRRAPARRDRARAPDHADRQRARLAAEGRHRPGPRARREGRGARGQGRSTRSATSTTASTSIVAQGYEAGGHTGEIATMVLVPEVVDAVAPVPVLAAGGIGTGRQIAAALALGAQGVWLGSLWLTTAESNSSPAVLAGLPRGDVGRHRAVALLHGQARAHAAQRVDRRVGRPATARARSACRCRTSSRRRPTRGSPARAARTSQFAPVGQIVGRMNEVRPVRDVMFELVEEYIETVERLEGGLQ